jgi:hydroxyacylglutathione hydrolase
MDIQQFVATSLGDASYLLVSGTSAAVVDPQRDVRPYVEAARARGATISYVFETHVHNDYVSGGPELAALGARIVAPRDAGLAFDHQPIADGDEVAVGAARLRAVHAPGHTHHHTAYLAIDERGVVVGAFTGGSIIMGGAGRSDLLGPDETEALTRLQWESARRLESALSGDAELLPTHGAGSFCSTQSGDGERRARLAVERPRNIVLSSPDFETFRVLHLANPGPIPAYYRHMAPINRRGPRVYGTPPRPSQLTLPAFEQERDRGTPVIDVRDRFAFARGHVPASISIEEGDATLAYVSWTTPFDSPLVLVTEDAAQADRLTVDLLRIGYEQVRGFLPFEAWHAARPVETLSTVSVAEARDLMTGRQPVYDVRFDSDRHDLPLPGSVARPIDRLAEWLPGADEQSPLVVCGGGSRATTAGSLLKARGREPLVLANGGAADLAPAHNVVR